jgi:hypothetical protein
MVMKNKTITVDLETWTPSVLSNNTDGIHPGEMMIFSGGRQTGKSMISSYYYSALKQRSISVMASNLCKEIFLPMHPATKPKYQFSRAKWYEADFWDLLALPDTSLKPKSDWCKEQFGPHPKNIDAWSRWYISHTKIYFRDEKDFVFYKLKWS